MNIRCAFCQTPYTLSRVAMLDALQEVDSKKLTHYDAHCPRCRRATQLPRQRLEMAMPKWRDELKEFEAEMRKNPQQEAPAPFDQTQDKPAPVAETASTPEPKATKEEKPAAKPKPAPTSPPKGKKATAVKKTAATPKEKKTTKKSK